ncbi:MAG: T9SS type A sorting domain-containing protein [bacterium]
MRSLVCLTLVCIFSAAFLAAAPVVKYQIGETNPSADIQWGEHELFMFKQMDTLWVTLNQILGDGKGKWTFYPTPTVDDWTEGVAHFDHIVAHTGIQRSKDLYLSFLKHCQKLMGFPYGRDWEHAGEYAEMFFGALDVAPYDSEMQELNLQFAQRFLADMNSNYLFTIRGTSDSPELLYLPCFFHAYTYTGEEKYRDAIVNMSRKWNELTTQNGGVIPGTVNHDGTIPANWYEGTWNYSGEYGLGIAGRAWNGWMPNAMFMTKGDTTILEGMLSTLEFYWDKGDGAMPYACTKNGTLWIKSQREAERGLDLSHDRPYELCFSKRAQDLLNNFGTDHIKKIILEEVQHPSELGQSFFVIGSSIFTALKTSIKPGISLTKGDDLTPYVDQLRSRSLGDTYLDGTNSGHRSARHGGTFAAPLRYWQLNGMTGLEQGLAACVTRVARDSVVVWFANTTESPLSVAVTGGFYMTHTIESVNGNPVNDRVVVFEVAPKSEAKVAVLLKRYTHLPARMPDLSNVIQGVVPYFSLNSSALPIDVFPNPISAQFSRYSITLPRRSGELSCEWYNAQGRISAIQTISAGTGGRTLLPVPSLSSGNYIIKIRNQGQDASVKPVTIIR